MPHQRSSRANLQGLEIMRFQLNGRREILKASALGEYMSSANIRFSDVTDDDSTLQANLAHFASHTFAHIRLPGASVEWPRSPRSQGRVVVIVTEGPGFIVTSDEPVIEREPGLFLVPPGSGPVHFSAASPTELLFVSCDIDSLAGIDLRVDPATETTPVESSQLRPLTSFVKSLCSITSGADEESVLPLARAGQEVTRSLVEMTIGNRLVKSDLFNLAMRLIVRDFARDGLDVRWAASKLHASVRTLQSAFTKNGTAFSRELRSVRLKAVDELRKRDTQLSVADAALAVGFGSSSAYYRAFKATQEENPSSTIS